MMIENKKRIFLSIIILVLLGVIYIFNPYKLEYIGYQSKVWAHRVNSLEKLSYAEKFYEGIELDVVYDSVNNSFDVNHPPAPSINLNLDTYFSKIKNKKMKLWIDFKNLSQDNSEDSSVKLNELAQKYQLNNDNIMVESTEMHLLQAFKSKGFRTSFYLPQLVDLDSNINFSNRIDSIKNLLEKYPTSGISSSVNSYEIINKYFPTETKFLWNLYSPASRNQIRTYKKFRKYVTDKTVQVVLIQVALPIGSR